MRRGGGRRLGRALAAAGKKPAAPAGKQQPAAKALARWENEGGRPAPRAMFDRGKKIEAVRATKKLATTKKAKPKRGTAKAKDRR